MQIIIPMSGIGARFTRAGYNVPKPLIEVEGKPIIEHVVNLFPGESHFLFICNEDHLAKTKLVETLKRVCPSGKIVGIAPHKKGPVHAVLQAADTVKTNEPVIVSYCDYGAVWDYAKFKKLVDETKCDGAVAGYSGFHPHMLRNHHYGYVQTQNDRVTDIREKQPYTDMPMHETALCGAYYFRSGSVMLEAMRELEQHDELRIEGEHYISLAYRFMLTKHADIRTYMLDHFMQWGTPEDLQEYKNWSSLFRAQMQPQPRAKHNGYVVMPMAGFGQRFADAGYKDPKPLIPVSGKAMAVQAAHDLPETPHLRCVLRRDLPEVERLKSELSKNIHGVEIVMLDKPTDGQAITALAALDGIADNTMITIASCDNGLIYNAQTLSDLFNDEKTDVIVWASRGHAPAMRKPQSYGWIDAEANGKITNVSVKIPLDDAANDPMIIGTFTFRRAGDFRLAVKHMIERNARVNNEFYIDTAINDAIALGLNCRLFTVDHYLGWGSPEELQTYLYWQKCFDVWPAHPYTIKNDPDAA